MGGAIDLFNIAWLRSYGFIVAFKVVHTTASLLFPAKETFLDEAESDSNSRSLDDEGKQKIP